MEELKKTWTHLGSFFTEWRVLEMGNVSLKVLGKSLNFLFKKGYEPWFLDF